MRTAPTHASYIQAVRGPTDVPRVLHSFAQLCAPGGIMERFEVQIALESLNSSTKGYGPEDLETVINSQIKSGQQMVNWYRMHTEDAEMWWCSSDMTDVVCDIASVLPLDVVLKPEAIPHPSGFVVFERPILAKGTQGELVKVDAILWGPSTLSKPGDERGIRCLSSVAFVRVDSEFEYPDGTKSDVPVGQEMWAPMGRSDWPLNSRLDEQPDTGFTWTEDQRLSIVEDRALLTALWTVAKTHTRAEITCKAPNRPERRRLARAGRTRPEETIRVIHLRREVVRSSAGDVDEHEVAPGHRLTHRHVVRAHPRWQACGPGRAERKLIIVPPHIKGPPGTPLIRSKRVWSLDR